MSMTRGNLPLNIATLSWRGLGRQFDATAKRFERRTHLQLGQLRKQITSSQSWFRERIQWLRLLESSLETAFETSRVMLHFAQKDAKRMLETYKNRYAKAHAKIAGQRDKHKNNEHVDSHKQFRKSKKDDAIGIPLADQRF